MLMVMVPMFERDSVLKVPLTSICPPDWRFNVAAAVGPPALIMSSFRSVVLNPEPVPVTVKVVVLAACPELIRVCSFTETCPPDSIAKLGLTPHPPMLRLRERTREEPEPFTVAWPAGLPGLPDLICIYPLTTWPPDSTVSVAFPPTRIAREAEAFIVNVPPLLTVTSAVPP
jgi:hypothetical protein